jgi:hypothetical protein
MCKNKKEKKSFSKTLLIQESVLIWIITIFCLLLAVYCVHNQYFADLPWITGMVGFPWTAYGVSQMYYYKKSLAENTKGGITHDTVMADIVKGEPTFPDEEEPEC